MSDVILDAGVAVAIANTERPKTRDWLLRRREAGYRNWLYVGQQSEMLRLLALEAEKKNSRNPSDAARDALTLLQASCFWLAALAEDGETLSDSDPAAVALIQAANRLGGNTSIVTDVPNRIERGEPFISLESSVVEELMTRPISLVDLSAQQDRLRAGLERNLHRVLHHGKFIQGPEIHQLEVGLAEYVGVDHCIGVSSGTDALLIALMALAIGPGDEVITTPFSFAATVEMINLVGATPIFVDVNPCTGNMDANCLESAVTGRTRVILPVSLYGQCADMTEINRVAERHQLAVIEDAAQSFGALHRGRKSCSLSTIGCTSFFPAKPLGAYGDAGAIFTSDAGLARIMRELSNHGQDGRYRHVRLGVNGRIDSIQAAVLCEKLLIFDDELSQRQIIADRYNCLLEESVGQADLTLPFIQEENHSAWAQYTIQVSDRDSVRDHLLKAGISCAVHYPAVLFSQPAFRQSISHCPHSVSLATKVISLPIHPYLNTKVQHRVIECLKEIL